MGERLEVLLVYHSCHMPFPPHRAHRSCLMEKKVDARRFVPTANSASVALVGPLVARGRELISRRDVC